MTVAWRREESADGHAVIVLTLHVQPGAARTEVTGVHGDALKVRLAAPPVDGKAFGVPRRNVTLIRGDTSRRKFVRIARPSVRRDIDWE
jgi:uncharacterized protein